MNPNDSRSGVYSSTDYTYDGENDMSWGDGKLEVYGFFDSDHFSTVITPTDITITNLTVETDKTNINTGFINLTTDSFGKTQVAGGFMSFASPDNISTIRIEPENLTSGVTNTLRIPTENGTLATREWVGATITSGTITVPCTVNYGASSPRNLNATINYMKNYDIYDISGVVAFAVSAGEFDQVEARFDMTGLIGSSQELTQGIAMGQVSTSGGTNTAFNKPTLMDEVSDDGYQILAIQYNTNTEATHAIIKFSGKFKVFTP